MKFLVLALCVCAASAASLGGFANNAYNVGPGLAIPRPGLAAQAAAQVFAPVVEPAYVAPAVKVVAPVPANTKVYGSEADAAVLRSDSDVRPDGFDYAYETNNGIYGQASGALKTGDAGEALEVQGSYKYNAPDGTPVFVSYTANENGYQPSGDVLPVGPETPDYIVRALQYIASHSQYVDDSNRRL